MHVLQSQESAAQWIARYCRYVHGTTRTVQSTHHLSQAQQCRRFFEIALIARVCSRSSQVVNCQNYQCYLKGWFPFNTKHNKSLSFLIQIIINRPRNQYIAFLFAKAIARCSESSACQAVFRFIFQNFKIFVNRLHDVLNVVEKKPHYTNGL